MKKTILIIGGAGFIGSNLIRFITYNSNNYNLISLDKLQDVSCMHNVYMNKSNNFYLADINDESILDHIFRFNKPSIIINLISDYCAIKKLHKICVKYDIEKFVNLSYPFYIKETIEDSPISSNNIYTDEEFSSYCIDNYITSKLFNLNYNIVRVPKCFGPRQQIFNTIPDLFYNLIKQENIVLPNKGMDVYDLLYVEDVCNAILLVLEKGADKNIYNASINLDYTEFELAVIVRDVLLNAKANNKIDYTVGNIALDDLVETIEKAPVNSDKIRNLGWKPLRKFRENIKYTVSWYMNNKWFFNI